MVSKATPAEFPQAHLTPSGLFGENTSASRRQTALITEG